MSLARRKRLRGPSSAERGEINRPVTIGGAIVSPDDLRIGDDDGLVALTPAMIRARIADAEARLVLEAKWEAALTAGQTAEAVFGLKAP
ncbi:hypothetical protein [Bosea robiniae]|uniref:Demethylmenaquinone methyltransferase n=1 Tax=Bosea robiniae TaxID=1036780 RepID=A0ABY0P4F3_9HYPH|nr:hypothetical protein [Bosea robiniae]SDH25603.1 Demethylmenaquinone methyltransferase [Bosea robiniae]